MSIHDVSGVVGWCLGRWEPNLGAKIYVYHLHTFLHHLHTFLFTLDPASTTLYSTHGVSRPHILYNISTTPLHLQLYSSSTVYNLYNTPQPLRCGGYVRQRVSE